MTTKKKAKRRPIKPGWTLLKILSLGILVYGGFSALMTLFPYYSPVALWIGVGLTTIGTIISIPTAYTHNWWGQIMYLHILFALFLGIAIRGWAAVLPLTWIWLPPLAAAYLLAWALPAIKPNLSKFFFREQMNPETWLGKAFFRLVLILAPSAIGISTTLGYYGPRHGHSNLIFIIVACLSSIVAIGGAQALAHQMWPQRPWAKDKDEEGMEE